VKLLLDENLPASLKRRLADVLPDITHVGDLDLLHTSDTTIWRVATRDGFSIVSKDDDFAQRSQLHGHPPKVIWLRIGNCSVAVLERCIRVNLERIEAFHDDPTASLLSLFPLRPH
jgi:predicted nuclease of predicted toxin-antitoxin system